jgi:hypothetical protein
LVSFSKSSIILVLQIAQCFTRTIFSLLFYHIVLYPHSVNRPHGCHIDR